MSLLRRIVSRLRGDTGRLLAVENHRLRTTVRSLRQKQKNIPRRMANARRAGMSQAVMDHVLANLGPGDVVFDCGANVGKVTAQLAATGATVHAFEPDPHALTILHRKFDGMANVTLHPVAIGNRAGTVTFWRTEHLDGNPDLAGEGNTLFQDHRSAGAKTIPIEVPMIDFAAFVTTILATGARVPFVKLDVEGAELDILPAMLDQGLFDRIGLTAAETHEFQIPDQAPAFAALRCAITARYPRSRVNLDWV